MFKCLEKVRISDKTVENIGLLVYSFYIFSATLAITNYFFSNEASFIAIALKLIRYFCYAVCCLIGIHNFKNKKYSINFISIYLIIVIIFLVCFLVTKDQLLLTTSFVFLVVYKVKSTKIIKASLIVQGIVLFSTVGLSVLGLIDNYISTGRVRDFLGFAYASLSSWLFFFICLLYINIRKEKVSIVEISIIMVINYFLYLKTDTKFPFILIILLIVILLALRFNLFNNKDIFKCKIINLVKYIPFVIVIFTIIMFFYPQNRVWLALDKIVSGRLRLGRNGVYSYGVSFFGNQVELNGFNVTATNVENYNYVDSGYLQFLILYGIVPFLAVLLMYVEIIKKSIKNKDIYMMISVIFVLLLSMFDPYYYNFHFNIFPVLAFSDYPQFEYNRKIRKFGLRVFKSINMCLSKNKNV